MRRVFELHVVDAAMTDGYVAAFSPERNPYGTEMGHIEAADVIAPSFRVFDVLLDAAAPIDDGVGSTGTDQGGDDRFAVARSNLRRAQVEANLPVWPQIGRRLFGLVTQQSRQAIQHRRRGRHAYDA